MNSEQWRELLQLGLTEGEAKVYISLLEIGSSTVGPIVQKSRVAYSNVYDILQRLAEKGIVSFIIKSKTKYFQAVNPSSLKEYLNKREIEITQQKTMLESILPRLKALQEFKPKQETELFIGKKGLRTAYEKLVEGTEKDDEDTFFYIHDEAYAEGADLFYFGISDILKKLSLRGISNIYGRKSDFLKKAKYIHMRYSSFPVPGNVEICKDKVLIVSWEKPIVATLIHSSSIANNFRTYFNEVWKTAK